MSSFRKAGGTIVSIATVISSALVWGDDGKLLQVKLGPLPVWDRRRWESRPFVKRWRRRRARRADG